MADYNNNYGGNNSNSRFGGRGNRDNSVNTNGIMFRHPSGKFMKVDYFNKCMTFSIGQIPAGQQLDFAGIRDNTHVQQTLVINQMFDFREALDELMAEIDATGTFTSAGVDAGAHDDSMIEISNGSNIGEQPGIYLVIYKGLDPQNKRCGNVQYYPLTEGKIYKDYDHTSGRREQKFTKKGQLKMVYEAVKESCAAFTMATAHTIQEVGKFEKLRTYRAMSALAASMGVDLTQNASFSNSNAPRGGGDSYGNNTNNNGGRREQSGWGAFSAQGNAGRMFEAPDAPPQDDAMEVDLNMGQLNNVPFGMMQ